MSNIEHQYHVSGRDREYIKAWKFNNYKHLIKDALDHHYGSWSVVQFKYGFLRVEVPVRSVGVDRICYFNNLLPAGMRIIFVPMPWWKRLAILVDSKRNHQWVKEVA